MKITIEAARYLDALVAEVSAAADRGEINPWELPRAITTELRRHGVAFMDFRARVSLYRNGQRVPYVAEAVATAAEDARAAGILAAARARVAEVA